MSLQQRLYVRLTALAVFAATIGGVLAALWMWAQMPGPPMRIVSAKALTETVRAGDHAMLQFTIERTRACPAMVYGFLVGPDGRALHKFDPELGGYSREGLHPLVVSRQIPKGISGTVCYRHTRIDSCTTRSYITAGPDVCFEVTP